MKTLLLVSLRGRWKTFVSFIFLTFLISCAENPLLDSNVTFNKTESIKLQAEERGKMFYDQIKLHALENPLNTVLDINQKKALEFKFDSLKTAGIITYESFLNQELINNNVSQITHDALLNYNNKLVEYVQQNSDLEKFWKWSLEQEDVVLLRQDLSDDERERILNHQSLLRNYIKFTLESNSMGATYQSTARTQGLQDILCYVGCAVSNISLFSGVGSKVGTYGTYVGAAVGLIYTILNSASCGCNTTSCGAATAVSTPDVCYSSTTGLPFTAWGYGVTPWQFEWNFWREDLNNPTAAVQTTNTDNYTLTNSIINGASQIAVRVISNCTGTLFYSQYYWVSPNDNGKPRPTVTAYQGGSNQVQYIVNGSNINSISWAYIPPYRGTVVATSNNSITVAWVANMRIGVSVTATSSCGTATTSTY